MLVIPVGIPGCGKTVLAGDLIEEGIIDPLGWVSPDRYREILTGDKHNQEVNDDAWGITNKVAINRMRYEQDVYLDATNLVESWYKQIACVAGLHEQIVLYIFFDNAMQAIQRNQQRNDPVPQHVMRKMIDRWKQVDLTNHDPSRVFMHDDPNLFDNLRVWKDKENGTAATGT